MVNLDTLTKINGDIIIRTCVNNKLAQAQVPAEVETYILIPVRLINIGDTFPQIFINLWLYSIFAPMGHFNNHSTVTVIIKTRINHVKNYPFIKRHLFVEC